MHLASVGNEVQNYRVYDEISKMQFLIQKKWFFPAVFFQFMVINTLDPDPEPDLLEIADPISNTSHYVKIQMLTIKAPTASVLNIFD